MKYSVVLTCMVTAGTAFPTGFSLRNIFGLPGHSNEQPTTQNNTSCERAFISALNTTENDVKTLVNAADSCFMNNGTKPVANFLSCVEIRALDQGVDLGQITGVIKELQQSCHSKRGMYVDHPFVRCAPNNSSSCAQMVMNTLNTTTDAEAKTLYDTAAVCLGNGTVPYKKYVACIRTAAPMAGVKAKTTSAFLAKLKTECAPNRRNFNSANKKSFVKDSPAVATRQTAASASCFADAAATADLNEAQMEVAQAAIGNCQTAGSDLDVYDCMKTYISSDDKLSVPRVQGVLAVAFNAYSCEASASSST